MGLRVRARMNSFADDRRFLKVAKSLKSVEAVAKEMGRKPESVVKTALRLGVSLKRADAPSLGKNLVKLGLKAKSR
jgi:hypothetical protein